MPRTCTVCKHSERDGIDRALLDGESFRDIARQYRVSKDAVARHKPHLSAALSKAYEAREETRVDGFRDRLETIWRVTKGALDKAQGAVRTNADGTVEDRSLTTLPALLSQAHRNLELLGRATGELQDNPRRVELNVLNVLSIARPSERPDLAKAGQVVEVPAAIEGPARVSEGDATARE